MSPMKVAVVVVGIACLAGVVLSSPSRLVSGASDEAQKCGACKVAVEHWQKNSPLSKDSIKALCQNLFDHDFADQLDCSIRMASFGPSFQHSKPEAVCEYFHLCPQTLVSKASQEAKSCDACKVAVEHWQKNSPSSEQSIKAMCQSLFSGDSTMEQDCMLIMAFFGPKFQHFTSETVCEYFNLCPAMKVSIAKSEKVQSCGACKVAVQHWQKNFPLSKDSIKALCQNLFGHDFADQLDCSIRMALYGSRFARATPETVCKYFKLC